MIKHPKNIVSITFNVFACLFFLSFNKSNKWSDGGVIKTTLTENKILYRRHQDHNQDETLG